MLKIARNDVIEPEYPSKHIKVRSVVGRIRIFIDNSNHTGISLHTSK